MLVSPAFRRTAIHAAVQQATAHVSPGPGYASTVAAIRRQETQLLDQVFEALKLSLAVAIQRGLLLTLLFCGAAILAALTMRDVPIEQRSDAELDQSGAGPDQSGSDD